MVQKTFIISGTVPANQAANSILPFKITFDPVRGAQDYYQTPTFGALAILPGGIYVDSAQGINGILRIKVNGVVIYETAPINTLLISNPSRPKDPEDLIILKGGDKLEVEFVNLEAGGTAPTDITIYMKVDEEVD